MLSSGGSLYLHLLYLFYPVDIPAFLKHNRKKFYHVVLQIQYIKRPQKSTETTNRGDDVQDESVVSVKISISVVTFCGTPCWQARKNPRCWLSGSILTTKTVRLQTEYMGRWSRMSLHMVSMDIKKERLEDYFSKYG